MCFIFLVVIEQPHIHSNTLIKKKKYLHESDGQCVRGGSPASPYSDQLQGNYRHLGPFRL